MTNNSNDETLGYDKSHGEGADRSGEPFAAPEKPAGEVSEQEAPKKRKTVNVHNNAGRALMLHLHQTIPDDGGGRSFQGRSLPDALQLRAGHTAGIDKEFMEKWVGQNKGLAHLVTFQDEDEPESAQREEHD